MVTLDAINLKIAKLQKQAATVAEKQASTGLTKIRDLMHKHGLSVADIESFVGKKHGRKSSASAAGGVAKAPRASGYHVAPKYADPKTGATWTGRGRAPAWISEVKDRSKFLIDAGEKVKTTSAKTAAAKKAVTKRVAAKKAVSSVTTKEKAPARSAASRAKAGRSRKSVATVKKAAAPRKVAAKKGAVAVQTTAAPEAAAE
ncbi:H-NS histone family protein [Paraburkholderia silviterrae]|uniref:H-NS histone family protein n=1 Tax=Paraburkholderia silviterrae TaxID=2528715 RepID=A0A4R5M5E4_9BURK|nr:H-NS histone family protein [Paraburkholderia silviterrae]TDG21165.1 H-NS histone family protein [Paraburkholderia silviterrae]